MLVHPDAVFRSAIAAHRETLDRARDGGLARAAGTPAAPAAGAPSVRPGGRAGAPALGRGRLRTARP